MSARIAMDASASRRRFTYGEPAATEIITSSAVLRVNRGGSWDDSVAFMRLSDRFNHRASNRNSNIGFRLARRYGEA